MTTLTIRVTSVCDGGDHLTVTTSGDFTHSFVVDAAQLRDFDRDDLEAFVRTLLFFARRGRTGAQLRSLAQTGFTVTV